MPKKWCVDPNRVKNNRVLDIPRMLPENAHVGVGVHSPYYGGLMVEGPTNHAMYR